MKNKGFSPRRRLLLKAAGSLALAPALSWTACAESRSGTRPAELRLRPAALSVRDGMPPVPVWSLDAGENDFVSRIKAGGPAELSLSSELAAPVLMQPRGADGARPTLIEPSATARLSLPSSQTGTMLLDPRLLNDGGARPFLPHVLVVEDRETFGADRDQIILIEDWKIGPDGTAQTPGHDVAELPSTFTINRRASLDIRVKANERLRLRIVNGCQRAVVALKIADHDVQVIAIDSKPAEPFVARNGQIVLAPGTRVDALLDAAQPVNTTSAILLHDGTKPMPIGRILTSGDPPVRDKPLALLGASTPNASAIDLKTAMRVDLSLDPAQWTRPADTHTSAPAFRVARGRTVVMAITNPGASAATFAMNGHHVRLLDRLDDGWKPFWLDTIAFNPGQTQRIAFAAEFAGIWQMHTMTTAWSSPRLVRSYEVA